MSAPRRSDHTSRGCSPHPEPTKSARRSGFGRSAPFSEWGRTFTDPRLAAAVVDRLTFRAHIIETGTNSYRLRQARAAKGPRKPKPDKEPQR